MSSNRKNIQKISLLGLIPPLGIFAFVGLFIYAGSLYPGGSQADVAAKGFDWVHNYWCNLLNGVAMNGTVNPARPFAIAGMILLCFSLSAFFVRFGLLCSTSKFWKYTIIGTGTVSMMFAVMIFTKYHDLMTSLASVFGVFVVLGILRELYHTNLRFWKVTSIICILLLAVNNYIYYSEKGLTLLPLLQKITFAVILIWIIGLNSILPLKSKVP